MRKPKVLFLCTGNACRTQMAEAILREIAGDRFEVTSAGHEATPLDPESVEAMREIGIDISGQRPKLVEQFKGRHFTYVISLCDRQQERTCPIFPPAVWQLEWPLDDPAAVDSPQEHRAVVRQLRDQIQRRVFEFANQHLTT